MISHKSTEKKGKINGQASFTFLVFLFNTFGFVIKNLSALGIPKRKQE